MQLMLKSVSAHTCLVSFRTLWLFCGSLLFKDLYWINTVTELFQPFVTQ